MEYADALLRGRDDVLDIPRIADPYTPYPLVHGCAGCWLDRTMVAQAFTNAIRYSLLLLASNGAWRKDELPTVESLSKGIQ